MEYRPYGLHIRRTGHKAYSLPNGPVLIGGCGPTANAAGTLGLASLPKHGGGYGGEVHITKLYVKCYQQLVLTRVNYQNWISLSRYQHILLFSYGTLFSKCHSMVISRRLST
jgi:hypothetical protein